MERSLFIGLIRSDTKRETSSCLVDIKIYVLILLNGTAKEQQQMSVVHFCMRPYRGFSTSCIGVWPGEVPGIVLTRPWERYQVKREGMMTTRQVIEYRTSFSNMHLFSVRSGFLQCVYSYV
jgi:hypothetical protein